MFSQSQVQTNVLKSLKETRSRLASENLELKKELKKQTALNAKLQDLISFYGTDYLAECLDEVFDLAFLGDSEPLAKEQRRSLYAVKRLKEAFLH